MGRMLVLICCLLAGQAHAGAWPREAGKGFASLSIWQGAGGTDSYTALFAEYGLLPRITLGLDAGRSVSGQTKTVAFLRAPFGQSFGWLIAAEIGLGEIAGQPVLRPGLSFGRNITARHGTGWIAVDTLLEVDLATQGVDIKTDITLGFTPGWAGARPADWTLMLQLQTGLVEVQDSLLLLRTEGIAPRASFLRIAPSATYRLNDRMHLEIGFFHALQGSDEKGVKIGLWSTF